MQDELEEFRNIDLTILPPEVNEDTDEDSGDEVCDDPDRLSRNQLQAEALISLGDNSLDDSPIIPSQLDSLDKAKPSSSKSGDGLSRTKNDERNSLIPRSYTAPKMIWIDGESPTRFSLDEWQRPNISPLSLSTETHPLEFFEAILTPEIVKTLVKFSVQYATEKNVPRFELSVDELYCFFGILYLSGYMLAPRRRMYWEEKDDCKNTLISNSMRRNRFEQIFRFLHAARNDRLNIEDKMSKLRPFINYMNESFIKNAPIDRQVSIDESMIPYFGRHGCKQFIRGKPVRFGFKAWAMATKEGYCIGFDVYQGRKEKTEVGLGESVVLTFLKKLEYEYPGLKFSIFTDNFFTSVRLTSIVAFKGHFLTGTVRENRTEKCPLLPTASMKKSPRGEYCSKIDKETNIAAVRWVDNNVVTFLSNEFGVQPLRKAKRYSRTQKAKIEIPQPNVVSQYNAFMGGVDQMDNHVSNYRIGIRGKKWYMPIFMWILDVTMTNSWILSKKVGCNLDNLGFRREVVQALLQKYGKKPLIPGPNTSLKVAIPARKASHLILTGQQRRRCVICASKTVKACDKCRVPLHDKCFSKYHM